MTYELKPTNGQKSFYGKALVKVEPDGTRTLYSYGTKIITEKPDESIIKYWGGWSATTGKHIKAFNGMNKAAFMAIPYNASPADKAAAYSGTLYR